MLNRKNTERVITTVHVLHKLNLVQIKEGGNLVQELEYIAKNFVTQHLDDDELPEDKFALRKYVYNYLREKYIDVRYKGVRLILEYTYVTFLLKPEENATHLHLYDKYKDQYYGDFRRR